MALTVAQLTELEGGIGPNAMRIRAQASLVVCGRIPAVVRKELMAAVKMGALGRLPKKGLLPEVFYHPDHKHGAKERQKREAEYAASCIAGVVA
ncbi:MAG: hypothetical protein AAFR47_22625 [Pseudomonadota bacterium]